MAINYFTGATSSGLPTDWNEDGNWSLNKPVDDQDVVIPARTRVSLLQNVDRTGDNTNAGLDLGSFTVERGYDGQLGQSGAPMQFSVSTGIVLHQGDGTLHYVPETGSAGSDDTNNIIIDSPNHELAAVIHVPDGITVRSVQCLSGHTEISTDAVGAATGVVSFLSIAQRGAGSQGPTVETSGDSKFATVTISGGQAVLGHTETNYLYVSGGTCTIIQSDLGITSQVIFAYILGGRVDWVGGLSTSMTTVELYAMGGVLNLNASSADKTIDVLVIHPGATVLHNRQWVTVTAYRDFGLDTFRSPDVSGTINTWLSVDIDWENVDNWDQGHIPADDEHVVIPGDATTSLLLNMDRTADTAGAGLRLASLTIHDTCTVDVGASDEPLKCTISGRGIHRGRGTWYFTAQEGSANVETIEVIIDSPNSSDAAVIVVPDDNVIQVVEVLRGRVTLSTADSVVSGVDSLHVGGSGFVAVAANSRVRAIVQSGGNVNLSGKRTFDCVCVGGKLRILSDVFWGAGLDIRVLCAGSGVTQFESTVVSGRDATVHAMGGTIDFNKTADAKVIDSLFVHPGAKVKANRPWITFDNTYDFGLPDRSGS